MKKLLRLKYWLFENLEGTKYGMSVFTNEFKSASLTKENMLNQHIDGITGATMSVRALTKVARLSLWLNRKVKAKSL
jgi:Na+-translocating ferredoxin:NAD+ oxidoreductase RnfG subunit